MKRNIIYIIFILLSGVFLGWLVMFCYFNFYLVEQENNQKSLLEDLGYVDKNDQKLKTVAFITPHHLVAKELIEEVFKKTAEENKNSKIDRIVLVSPNHFNSGGGNFIVSDQDWNVEGGSILSDKSVINILQKDKLAYLQNDIFQQEHGITALLPFVKKYYNEIPVISLIIRDGTNESEIDKLADFFNSEKVEGNTLMILSSDFSHELDKNISFIHDQIAIDAIQNFDFDSMSGLETDCLGGLRLVLKFAQANNYNNFNLLGNSNSSEIYNKFFIGENTSYVTGYFSKNSDKNFKESKSRPISLLFGGDVMLDRSVRLSISQKGVKFLTEKIERLFLAQDIVMINLEGAVTSSSSVSNVPVSNPNHYRFTFDKEQTKDFFSLNNVNVVSAGNNHIYNFGVEGEQETRSFLEENNIAYTGMPNMREDNSVIKEIKGRKIAFVAYNYSAGLTQDEVIDEIEKMKSESDFVVVYAHWGLEYHLRESESQRSLAHMFVDAGADVIIGSHPHVIQPIEIYNDKVIFYSLGNMIFDQYFSQDVRERLMVDLLLENDGISFVLVPLYASNNGQLELMNEEMRDVFLNRIAEDSGVSDIIKEGIKDGMFSIILSD